MSGKAFAGIADLRAKFENKDDTPPPSRGRSPAGQEDVKGSGRKIRTSFISVERSGHMSPSLNQSESMGSNDGRSSVTGGSNQPNTGADGGKMEGPKTNGAAVASGKQDAPQSSANEQNGLPVANNAANGTLELNEATKSDAINPDKPATAGEDDAPAMLPLDPKDENAVSGGAALAPKGESIGALLKGSDFEPEKEESTNVSSPKKSPKKASAPAKPTTPVKKSRDTPKSTPAKPPGTSKVNGSPRSKPASARPSTVSKPQASSPAKPAQPPTPLAESSNAPANAAMTPASPTASKTPQQKSPKKTASPKQRSSKQDTKVTDAPKPAKNDVKKPTPQKSSHPTTSAKPPQSAVSTTTKPNASASSGAPRRSGPHSPNTIKPKPRSPTRPVRLPGAATASTAASSAKTSNTAPPRPESRAAVSNPTKAAPVNKPAAVKGPAKLTASNLRHKAPRSSLPASTTDQKPKLKPRTSTTSTRAPGNDFLSRMMRPTQSSASKTHEKVEPKTPPKKRVSARPKRVSNESGEQAEGKPVEAELQPQHEEQTARSQTADHAEGGEQEADQEMTEEALREEAASPGADNLNSKADNLVATQ